MTILEILYYPNNLLRQKGVNIEIFDESLEIIIKNMLETMYSAKGIGLAAIQVNIIKNIIVIDISEKRNEPVVLINPVITRKEEKIEFEEGCLSVPGFYEKVNRFNVIEYEAKDLQGKKYNAKAEGLFAVCIQHEIDHLNGRLFVDYLSMVKRESIAKKIQKMDSEGIKVQRKKIPYSI